MVVQLDSHCCFSCSSCAVSNLYYVFNLFTLSLLKLAATVGLVTVCRWYFFLPDSFYVKVYTYQIEKAWVDLSSQKLPLHIGELTENCRPTLCYFKHQCFTAPITLERHYQHNPTNKVGSWLANIVLHIAAKEPDMTKLNKHY